MATKQKRKTKPKTKKKKNKLVKSSRKKIKTNKKVLTKMSATKMRSKKSRKNNNGVYLVPAFTGLGAPYWSPNSRGLLSGLTRNTDWKDIVRAVLESVAYQSFDLFKAMNKDGLKPKEVKVDGGMVLNNWFSQFLSDILDLKVIRPKINETTALGAAFVAGLYIGEFKSLKSIYRRWKIDKRFDPKINKSSRNKLLKGWEQAIKRTLI